MLINITLHFSQLIPLHPTHCIFNFDQTHLKHTRLDRVWITVGKLISNILRWGALVAPGGVGKEPSNSPHYNMAKMPNIYTYIYIF